MEGTSQGKGDHVKVTVRVRPLSQRDRDDGRRPVLHTTKRTATLQNPALVEGRAFTFDRCFWSADPAVRGDGRRPVPSPPHPLTPVPPQDPEFASQRTVFKEVGRDVAGAWRRRMPQSPMHASATGPGLTTPSRLAHAPDAALAGYNSSLFAYGQTGTGKTYTVIGDGVSGRHAGLIPRVCEHVFRGIVKDTRAAAQDGNWREARAPDGRPYFYHTGTLETRWERPDAEPSGVVYEASVRAAA